MSRKRTLEVSVETCVDKYIERGSSERSTKSKRHIPIHFLLSKPYSTPHKCFICWDEFKNTAAECNNNFRCCYCSTFICRTCLDNYIRTCTKVPIKCLQFNCTAPIPSKFIPASLLQRVQQEKAATARVKQEDGDDEQINQLILENGWRKCPNCGVCIEKIVGCNHIQCTLCDHEFCYRCSSKWDNSSIGCTTCMTDTNANINVNLTDAVIRFTQLRDEFWFRVFFLFRAVQNNQDLIEGATDEDEPQEQQQQQQQGRQLELRHDDDESSAEMDSGRHASTQAPSSISFVLNPSPSDAFISSNSNRTNTLTYLNISTILNHTNNDES